MIGRTATSGKHVRAVSGSDASLGLSSTGAPPPIDPLSEGIGPKAAERQKRIARRSISIHDWAVVNATHGQSQP